MSSIRRILLLAAACVLSPAAGLANQLPAPADAAAPLFLDAAAKPKELLQRLPIGGPDATFGGELATRAWPVFVKGADVGAPTRLQIALSSSVSVLPERSRITVSINDQVLVEANIGEAGGDQVLTANVPAGLLVPGFNGIKVAVSQRHRVDCSIRGTYELWSRIDPTRTGFLRPATQAATAATASGIESVGAVPIGADGTTPIRIRRDPSDLVGVNRALRVVEALVLAGHIQRPVIDIAAAPGGNEGLDVVVGTSAEVAGSPTSDAPAPASRLDLGSGGRSVFTVAAMDNVGLDSAIADLERTARQATPTGSPAGLAALAGLDGYDVSGEQQLDFDTLGVSTDEFTGHLYRAGFRLRLPADFLAASYGSARIQLDGTVASRLLPADRLTVWVNGSNVAGFNLAAEGDTVLTHRMVELPLGVFHPGLNDIRVEAETLTAADSVCDAANPSQEARLRLAPSSTITFPTLARAAKLPDLATMPTAGHTQSKPALAIYVPGADPQVVNAAATLAANLVQTSGQLVGASLRYERPPSLGTGIVMAPLDQLPGPLAAGVAGLTAAPARPDKAMNADQGALSFDGVALRNKAEIGRWVGTAYEGATHLLEQKGLLYGWADRGAPPSLPKDGVLMLQMVKQAGPGWRTELGVGDVESNWSIVTASTAADLSLGLQGLVRQDRFHQLTGEVASYSAKTDDMQLSTSRRNVFVQTQPLAWTNARIVVAGMLSLNSNIFALILLLACTALGLSTRILVRRYGIKR